MGNDEIKVDIDKIVAPLVAIRLRHGLEKADVILRVGVRDIPSEEISNVKVLFHRSGLLIDPKSQSPVFVYIRDHTVGVDPRSSPDQLKKVHFTVCRTLLKMDGMGRFESRYHITNRKDDKYLIEFSGGREQVRALYPCQNCLSAVDYQCFGCMPPQSRYEIVKKFRAKDAHDLLWQVFDIFKKSLAKRKIRTEYAPTCHHSGWKGISKEYRKRKKFTCEQCKVNLSMDTRLLDGHHKDGNKRNNEDDNLECLCKICHSKQPFHAHYCPTLADIEAIKAERRRQGISPDA